MRTFGLVALIVLVVAAVAVGVLTATNGYYYETADGQRCATCHEIRPMVESFQASTHRDLKCSDCHGSSLAADLDVHLERFDRWQRHRSGESPEEIRIRHPSVAPLVARCAACHAQEHGEWGSGPHAVTYSRLFLDEAHNSSHRLMDDCLRCHGMHFSGGIRALVAPLNNEGPWQLINARMYAEPAIPCLACHTVHGEGLRSEGGSPGSLAFFDRRVGAAVPVADLPLPEMRDGVRLVDVSTDERQALCYQCHAPRAGFQVGSGDDRTPMGVHEGVSCLGCHDTHDMSARISCATCHGEESPNCGLDVTTMDTTFSSPASLNDIHQVSCEDCHTSGRPLGDFPVGMAFD